MIRDIVNKLKFAYHIIIGYLFRLFSLLLLIFVAIFISVYIASLFRSTGDHYPPAALLMCGVMLVFAALCWGFSSHILQEVAERRKPLQGLYDYLIAIRKKK